MACFERVHLSVYKNTQAHTSMYHAKRALADGKRVSGPCRLLAASTQEVLCGRSLCDECGLARGRVVRGRIS